MPDKPTLPVPQLAESPELAPHFDGLRKGQLILPRCDACSVIVWYPRAFCPSCGSTTVTWVESRGRGTVYSFTIVRKGVGPFADCAPYVVAYIELDEGPRVLTNIVGAPEEVAIGAEVTARYELDADGTPILRFQLLSTRAL
jgi:uncharacterized OB-fold protein